MHACAVLLVGACWPAKEYLLHLSLVDFFFLFPVSSWLTRVLPFQELAFRLCLGLLFVLSSRSLCWRYCTRTHRCSVPPLMNNRRRNLPAVSASSAYVRLVHAPSPRDKALLNLLARVSGLTFACQSGHPCDGSVGRIHVRDQCGGSM